MIKITYIAPFVTWMIKVHLFVYNRKCITERPCNMGGCQFWPRLGAVILRTKYIGYGGGVGVMRWIGTFA